MGATLLYGCEYIILPQVLRHSLLKGAPTPPVREFKLPFQLYERRISEESAGLVPYDKCKSIHAANSVICYRLCLCVCACVRPCVCVRARACACAGGACFQGEDMVCCVHQSCF